ncbi:MAG: class I SAM-dependent methyltransferase, partial [Candidatus Binatia bacterium]
QYKAIYAVEPVRERIEFMNLRFRQQGCRNIKLIRSDIDNLPLPEGSFDLVVLNGLLEWLPFGKRDMSPHGVQIYYLRLLRKLLNKNGYIYIGIENRFYYGHFVGHCDPHIPVSYVTVLPRPLADLICRYKIGDIYRPYLYSHRGYRQLLRDAGFQDIEIYSALPSYNDPQYLICMKSSSIEFNGLILTSERKAARFMRKILLRTDNLKYFGYGYIILARNRQ